jgi:hypothetical protein
MLRARAYQTVTIRGIGVDKKMDGQAFKTEKNEGAHANLLQAFMLMVVKQVKAQEKSTYIYIARILSENIKNFTASKNNFIFTDNLRIVRISCNVQKSTITGRCRSNRL